MTSKTLEYQFNRACDPALERFLLEIRERFGQVEESIQAARNDIKLIPFMGKEYVVKSFKKPHPIKAWYYSKQDSKAKRSYEHALKLGELTPRPIGYIAYYKGAFLQESYYISDYFEYDLRIERGSLKPLRSLVQSFTHWGYFIKIIVPVISL